MNRELPRPSEIWNHFKNNPYLIIDIAEHTENGKMLVVYRQLYAPFKVYCRPLEMFMSETDTAKYPYAKQKYRFERVDK